MFQTPLLDFLRSFPVLVMLILIFYSLPFFGLSLGAFTSVVLALTLNNTGYFDEIFRAGFESIPKGQYEASYALGVQSRHLVDWI
jgi:polar amino acid transport system permease protein